MQRFIILIAIIHCNAFFLDLDGVSPDAKSSSLDAQSPNKANMKLNILASTKCLDGSSAGYYISKATTASDTWVINLQGGGVCSDEASCTRRAKTVLGSSKHWASTYDGSNSPFLQPNSATNPDFFGANRVFIPYCTGDIHTGTQTSTSAQTFGLWFSGSVNLKLIIDHLVKSEGMGNAKYVMLTGESAGGMGTFMQVDKLVSYFDSDVVIKGVPVSGWFMPAETGDFNATGPLPHKIAWNPPTNFANYSAGKIGGSDNTTARMHNAAVKSMYGHDSQLKACVDAHPHDGFVCNSLDSVYQYVKAPLFVIENMFDQYAITNVEGLIDTSSAAGKKYMMYYGRATRVSLSQVGDASKPGDGLFMPACFSHTGDFGASKTTSIKGVSFAQAAADWFWERGQTQRILIDDCVDGSGGLPCNPSCA